MFSYHNHSNFSDGHSLPEEMVVSAYNHKMKEIGLSDHFAVSNEITNVTYSMNDISKYVKVMETLKECYAHKIIVKMGVELDYVPGTMDEASNIISQYAFDYIIGGIHFIKDFPLDESKSLWEKLTSEELNKKIEEYWKLTLDMCKTSDIDIVAHMGIYEKWCSLNNIDYSDYFEECLKVIEDRGLVVELNTARKVESYPFYPNEKFFEILSNYNIPVIISSDGHYPVHVTRHFEEAMKLLKKYNIQNTAKFEKRKILIENII